MLFAVNYFLLYEKMLLIVFFKIKYVVSLNGITMENSYRHTRMPSLLEFYTPYHRLVFLGNVEIALSRS